MNPPESSGQAYRVVWAARLLKMLGSLTLAAPLLVVIAGVLAWGTIYETRFGTAAVQRFVYQAWWFQALLGFLAVNLAVAALARFPWNRRQLPFLLAHLGIILILVGGIIGGRFGIEGQMIIPEGQDSHVLELPIKQLVVHQPNPGTHVSRPVHFESQAWVHEPNVRWAIPMEDRTIELTVDRYYPDAVVTERVTGDGAEEHPALELSLAHEDHRETHWVLARDPQRFGFRWGEAHILFLEVRDEEMLARLAGKVKIEEAPRGVVAITLPGQPQPFRLPVPEPNASGDAHSTGISHDTMGQPQPLAGTAYTITFKDYFPDFVLGEHGPETRSPEPNNPAVSLVLTGPEGTDAYLLFALHPEISAMHGWRHVIPAQVTYTHQAGGLPPNTIALLRTPAGLLASAMTGGPGQLQYLDAVAPGQTYAHPWLSYQFTVVTYHPRAAVTQDVGNRSDRVRGELLHITARRDTETAETWVGFGNTAELRLGEESLMVEYGKAQRPLPFMIALKDFRKIDYPGTQMAAGFEADVELRDPERGVTLARTISMNNPLKYQGYTFFQASFIPGPTETTVLAVRNDPGTPLVYTGFLIVVGGVVAMFTRRRSL